MYSPSITKLLAELKKLPSVGEHTAERFVFYWLKGGKKDVTELLLALKNLIKSVKSCDICWNFSDTNPCHICSDNHRDTTTICVVADVQDLSTIEQTGAFNGRYHVLRGVVDPTEEKNLERLKVKELFQRLSNSGTKVLAPSPSPARGEVHGKGMASSPARGEVRRGGSKESNSIKEIILAFSPDVAGETTMLYLKNEITKRAPHIKLTRLARGLPMGSDLKYADEITLSSALKGRTAN